jgi:hypothetical protein
MKQLNQVAVKCKNVVRGRVLNLTSYKTDTEYHLKAAIFHRESEYKG